MSRPENLISTSVEDCAITVRNSVDSDPGRAIDLIASTLRLMNASSLDHKSRRAVLVREGKRAITELGKIHEKQAL